VSKRKWVVGVVVAIAILAMGAVVLWALPGDALAWHRAGGGNAESGGTLCTGTADAAGSGYRGGRGNMGNGMQGTGLGRQGNAGLDGTCDACSEGRVSGSLTEAEVSALTAALEDEHRAKALYEQAIADLGSVRPFTQILKAEERHIAAIERVFTRYGMEIPAAEAGGQAQTFATLADACAAGVAAETGNIALYVGLFPQVEKPDVTRVLTALQSTSRNSHLPALDACAP
jgi:hypothetical protein